MKCRREEGDLSKVEERAGGNQVDEIGTRLANVDVSQGLQPALVSVHLPLFRAKSADNS